MLKRSYLLIVLILFIGTGIIAIKCSQKGKVQTPEQNFLWRNHSDSAKYVGIQTCRSCHNEIYQTYIETGMGKSFGLANKTKSSGNFHNNQPIIDRINNLSYLPFFRDSSLYIKEYRLYGKDTIHSRTEKINYIVGSGHHTNSHIINQNGYLFQAPFTFYVQKGKWDLAPGFENGYNSRFNRALGLECISCHNALPNFESKSFNKFTTVPMGIDCERCHGPGSIHVDEKLAGKIIDTSKKTDYSIVNPKKLSYSLQIDICQRCHLQGNAVLKKGKSFFDFKPGMSLKSVMDIYFPIYEKDESSFLMASHAQRFQRSECFLKSNDLKKGTGNFNCITCHNPHISVKKLSTNYFNEKCQSCHNSLKQVLCSEKKAILLQNSNDCVKCHMPVTGAVDIPHVTIHDHWIRKYGLKESKLPKKVGTFQGLFAPNNSNPSNESLAKAYLYFYEKFEHKEIHLDSALKYTNRLTFPLKQELLIDYYFLKNRYLDIVKLVSENKYSFTGNVTLYRIGESFLKTNDPKNAQNYFEKSVKSEPFNLDYRNKLILSEMMNKDFEGAKKDIDFVLNETPKNATALNLKGFYYLVKGNISEAEKNINYAIKLDPDFEEAEINQVKISFARNEFGRAKNQIERLEKKYPKSEDIQRLKSLIN